MASAARGYSDYYKNNTVEPQDTDTMTPQGATTAKPKKPDVAEDKRKAAIRRRLLARRAGK